MAPDPNWNYQAGQEETIHRDHIDLCLLWGMKRCTNQPVNYDKIKEVTQEPYENPALFHAHSSRYPTQIH